MLQIEASAKDAMIQDAVHAFPDECCGFLFGTDNKDQRIVVEAVPVINAKEGDKRRRFAISARDYLNAERYAEQQHLQLLGVYHSHPNHPAIPSETDRLAAVPNFSYIIISVMNREFADLRSWQLGGEDKNGDQFEEEELSRESGVESQESRVRSRE